MLEFIDLTIDSERMLLYGVHITSLASIYYLSYPRFIYHSCSIYGVGCSWFFFIIYIVDNGIRSWHLHSAWCCIMFSIQYQSFTQVGRLLETLSALPIVGNALRAVGRGYMRRLQVHSKFEYLHHHDYMPSHVFDCQISYATSSLHWQPPMSLSR